MNVATRIKHEKKHIMRKVIIFILILVTPTFCFGQNLDTLNSTEIERYLDKIDLSFEYADKIDTAIYKNVITTNYWTNDIKVNFFFKDDNLSYLTTEKFDNFRRQFYVERKLNVYVFLKNENALIKKFHKIYFENKEISYLKLNNFIATTICFPEKERFIQIYYYLNGNKIISVKIEETDLQFQYDSVNITEFYCIDDKFILERDYQTLMDAEFILEKRFTTQELENFTKKLFDKIINENY